MAVTPPFPVDGVVAVFCGVVACEYTLALPRREFSQTRAALEKKHGVGAPADRHKPCDWAESIEWSDGTNLMRLSLSCPADPAGLQLSYFSAQAADQQRRVKELRGDSY